MRRNRVLAANPIDRRHFLRAAGMFAASSVFGSSWLGCGASDGVTIPCLGPAAAPAQVPGMTYVKASEIGCALDCNLHSGRSKLHGGAATDDAPKINAALAGASASNPITLILDGSALISGLNLPAGGYWNIAGLGCGTGFFIQSAANSDGIHNGPAGAGNPADPGPPAPPRGKNVSLKNFTINGNQGNGHSGDSTSGKAQGPSTAWFCCINLMSLDNINVEKVVVVNSPAYHFRFSNVGNVKVDSCILKSSGPSTDGLHFDGPANDISISNCEITNEDDAIALNCGEGYSGDISRVTVSNCYCNSFSMIRLQTIPAYGSPLKYYIDNVIVSNCTGNVEEAGFLIGSAAGSNPNSLKSLTISDCNITGPSVLEVGANFGSIALQNITFNPSGSTKTAGYAFLRTSTFFWGATYTGANLSLRNCSIIRSSKAAVVGVILEYNSVIQSLEFNGFWVADGGSFGESTSLVNISAGQIGQLVVDAIESKEISSPVSPGGFGSVNTVSGAGVLQTAWEFPDAVMADEVPYISASTHEPAIKIAGVVQPY